ERDSNDAPRVVGSHRNVAVYRSGSHRVAVKAVPFESAGDLVRLAQAHQYVHGVQVPALMAQADSCPELAGEILAAATGLFSERRYTRDIFPASAMKLFEQNWTRLFTRNIGPLLHQVTVDYEHKLMLTVLDWSEHGMLSDMVARRRLLEDCSLSHR